MQISNIWKILFIIISLSILVLSLIPNIQTGIESLSDKMIHVIAYIILAFSFIFAFSLKKNQLFLLTILSIIICTSYGTLIEGLQYFTRRSPEILDIMADLAGSTTGSITAVLTRILLIKLRTK